MNAQDVMTRERLTSRLAALEEARALLARTYARLGIGFSDQPDARPVEQLLEKQPDAINELAALAEEQYPRTRTD